MEGSVFTGEDQRLPSVVASIVFGQRRSSCRRRAGAAVPAAVPSNSRSSAHCPSLSFLRGLEMF